MLCCVDVDYSTVFWEHVNTICWSWCWCLWPSLSWLNSDSLFTFCFGKMRDPDCVCWFFSNSFQWNLAHLSIAKASTAAFPYYACSNAVMPAPASLFLSHFIHQFSAPYPYFQAVVVLIVSVIFQEKMSTSCLFQLLKYMEDFLYHLW